MTMQEFKAWFEGFTEGLSDVPNEKQWKRIKERVGQIDGVATKERIFIDHYWPRPYHPPYWYATNLPVTISNISNSIGGNTNHAVPMYALGRIEAAEQ